MCPLYTCYQVSDTDERIDYEQLKQQERIYFYDDVILYEDELADNGIAVLSVKIVRISCVCSQLYNKFFPTQRVMATGFFILLRFFLRVDGVLVRLIDTRIYHQVLYTCVCYYTTA